ncbi:uncharacterized protein LOC143343072 [Colletes latitarsis]|uniref:uncharacterized protein LOC143343072 n=1 Tax=Colletes latitarsis TaxID=2605962 RepID=UPI0040365481
MAKAIYVLKIYLFCQEVNNEKIIGINDLYIFIVNLYIEAWFAILDAAKVSHQNLQFLQNLYKYKEIDESVNQIGSYFDGHLWYLHQECAGLSFFDTNVAFDARICMIKHLNSRQIEIFNKETLFNISTSFLQNDPSIWDTDETYKVALEIVTNKDVKDVAKRGVKLITEYNNLLTKDKENKPYILQILKEYRRCYPYASIQN